MLIGLRVVILSKIAENHLPFLFVGNKHAKLAILTHRCQYWIDLTPHSASHGAVKPEVLPQDGG